MKPVVLITGGSGMLANELSCMLSETYDIRFLTRVKRNNNDFLWDVQKQFIDTNALLGVDYIVHLAGASVADGRWTNDRKREIISSRVDSSRLILDNLKKNNLKIRKFISASAIGYYGTKTTENIYTEEDPLGNGFLSEVCYEWEKAAEAFKEENVAEEVAKIMIGVILARNGGAFQKLTKVINARLGAVISKGSQYIPWIHVNDLCGIINLVLSDAKINGAINAVAPAHTTNEELTIEVAHQLGKKILLPNIPKFVVKFLFGEKAVTILEGSRVSSNKISKIGYTFEFKNINEAVKNLLEK